MVGELAQAEKKTSEKWRRTWKSGTAAKKRCQNATTAADAKEPGDKRHRHQAAVCRARHFLALSSKSPLDL